MLVPLGQLLIEVRLAGRTVAVGSHEIDVWIIRHARRAPAPGLQKDRSAPGEVDGGGPLRWLLRY